MKHKLNFRNEHFLSNSIDFPEFAEQYILKQKPRWKLFILNWASFSSRKSTESTKIRNWHSCFSTFQIFFWSNRLGFLQQGLIGELCFWKEIFADDTRSCVLCIWVLGMLKVQEIQQAAIFLHIEKKVSSKPTLKFFPLRIESTVKQCWQLCTLSEKLVIPESPW